jgi:hypothetical protein
MKFSDLLNTGVVSEANVAQKIIKDPRQSKMLAIAWKHDATLPQRLVVDVQRQQDQVKTEQEKNNIIVNAWSSLLDDTLRRNDYGDLSADGKFDEWLTRLYINGQADFEDINGEGGDALGAWRALSIRGKLLPQHQDFNKFTKIGQIQKIVRIPQYARELERIKDSEKIEKMKREKLDIVLVDDEKYYVIIPFNYGACYTFGNAEGYKPNFCTSSSSGASWFNNYAPAGPIISIVNKENIEDKNGKWQLHAPTYQIVNADQDNRHDKEGNDKKFSELFPGLMKRIGDAMEANAEQIKEMSKPFTNQIGYDVEKAVKDLKTNFPQSWNSKVEEPKAEEPAADGPGTYLVTQIATGRTARIPAQSLEDARQQLLARYPDYNLDDYTFELTRDEA